MHKVCQLQHVMLQYIQVVQNGNRVQNSGQFNILGNLTTFLEQAAKIWACPGRMVNLTRQR